MLWKAQRIKQQTKALPPAIIRAIQATLRISGWLVNSRYQCMTDKRKHTPGDQDALTKHKSKLCGERDQNAADDLRDDAAMFRDAVGDVKPVNNDRRAPDPPKKRPIARSAQRDDKAVMEELLEDFSDNELLETGEHLAWTAPGLQKSVLRKLKSGKFAIQAELDLHGHTRQEAKQELQRFIHACRERDYRCMRIIHGRGRKSADREPVLKRALDGWLRQPRQVLAYCSARDNDGGTGAVYVLLKKINS